MPTTTTTTPQPTGIHTFKCWDNEIPRVYPLIHPWPCCGLQKHPNNIFGTISYTSLGNAVGGPNGQTINACGDLKDGDVTLSIPANGKCPNDQFFMFWNDNVPIQVYFTYPCWTASEFYPSSGLFGFSSSFSPIPGKVNSGGCTYSNGSWKFFGGYEGVQQFGMGNCKMTFQIKGIG